MAHDPFTTLGLVPGRCSPGEVRKRFLAARARVIRALDDPRMHEAARRELDDLHLAYATLRDPRRQEDVLRQRAGTSTAATELRLLIRSSLESGLLRHSRREAILARAAELGINEFQAQLLIAQVQFGDEGVEPEPARLPYSHARSRRAWAGVAGVGVLALAMFLLLVQWVSM